jgi:hypothetical protein
MKYFYDQFCTVNFLPMVAKEQKYSFLINGLYCIGGCVVYMDAKHAAPKKAENVWVTC